MQRQIKIRDGWIEKRYTREHLLVDDEVLFHRLARITEFTRDHEVSPETRFEWTGDELTLRQVRISKAPGPEPGSQAARTALEQLAQHLESLTLTLVHGDITRKNLVYDGARFHLVDWEPALRQIRDGRATLLYTEPYLSVRDRLEQKLSVETDKISFFFVCWRMLHGGSPILERRALVHRRAKNKGVVTPIPEPEFLQLSFPDLLRLAGESGEWRTGGSGSGDQRHDF